MLLVKTSPDSTQSLPLVVRSAFCVTRCLLNAASISDGTLSPGAQLPTEVELTEHYKVARNTARQALTSLVNEGLITPSRPRGYFVRERKPLHYRPQEEFRPRPISPEMDIFLVAEVAGSSGALLFAGRGERLRLRRGL
jgi:Bacterial regulatory proteins, gntR family